MSTSTPPRQLVTGPLPTAGAVVLRAMGMVKRFGGLTAVDQVDLDVGRGEIVGLIGPNGAGKTTLFDCIGGFLDPDEGRVELCGRDVTGWPVEKRARVGLGRTFQRLEVFGTMTVREHLLVAAEHAGGVPTPWTRRPRASALERVERTLGRLGLDEHADVCADDLPTATLRRVEIARAVCTGAAVLLLDEPASGLDPNEVDDLATALAHLRDAGHAILLVEHAVGFVLGLADRVDVMQTGAVIASGPPEAVIEDEEVRRAYLGEGERD